jgi:hypothetical protein
MRDQDAGGLCALYAVAQQPEYVRRTVGIEIPRRFVGEDETRTMNQCSRDGDTLHLAARELAWECERPFCEADIS